MALTKKDVLSKVNEVLVVAGLNDNVWSIRDCDSMLFGLMYKKLFGKLPGVNPSPASAADHQRNFEAVVAAVSSSVLDIDLSHISPSALAAADPQARARDATAVSCSASTTPTHRLRRPPQAIYNLAEIFSELCEILLQREEAEGGRPASMRDDRPATADAGATTAVVAAAEPAASGMYRKRPSLREEAAAAVKAACASACAAAAPAQQGRPKSNKRPSADISKAGLGMLAPPTPKGPTPASASSKPRPRTAGARLKGTAGFVVLKTASKGTLPPKRASPPRPASAPGRKPATPPRLAQTAIADPPVSLHLEREITALQASFTMDSSDEAEAAAAAAVGAFDMKLAEEFGERRARVYSRVVKSQIAGVRQAERLEIARGMVAARNAARDERIQAIRQARIAEDSARAKASREIRRAAKDDLAYRQMYQAALASAKEKLLMEIQAGHYSSNPHHPTPCHPTTYTHTPHPPSLHSVQAGEETRRTLLKERRARQEAMDHFYREQVTPSPAPPPLHTPRVLTRVPSHFYREQLDMLDEQLR